MTYYQLTGHIFNLLPYFFIISIFFVKKNLTEYLLILFFTFGSVYLYDYRVLGVISLQQISLIMIALLYFVLPLDSIKKVNLVHFKKKYLTIFIYFTIVTLLFHFIKFDFKVQGNLVQNELRSVFQIVQMGFLFLASLVILSISNKSAKRIFNYFVLSIVLLAVFGILQEMVYLIFNFDIFPMRKDFFNSLNGITDKMYGFVRITVGIGEPKQVAKYLNIGLSCFLFAPSLLYVKKYRLFLSAIIALGILFTFSTTGYIILFSQIFAYILIKYRKKLVTSSILIVSLLLVFLIIFLKSDFFIDKIEYLVSIGDIPLLENSDSAVVKFFIDNPQYIVFGVGIGNIVAFAYPYAPSGSQYINNAPYTLRRGIIKNLAEGGIIGSILINSLFLSFIKRTKNINIKYLIIFFVFYYNFLTVEALNEFFILFITLLYSIDCNTEIGASDNETINNNP